VQGFVVTDPEALAEMDIPSGESVVEIPDLRGVAVHRGPQPGLYKPKTRMSF